MRIDEIIENKQDEAPILAALSALPPMDNAMIHMDALGRAVETPAYEYGVSLIGSQNPSNARALLEINSAALHPETDFATSSSVTTLNANYSDLASRVTMIETGGNLPNGVATTSYVDNKVASLVDSAPSMLDTLKELSSALGNDPNFSTTITAALGTKASTAYVDTSLSLKANQSDLTTGLEGKSNINHTHSWSEITNKPTLFSGSYTDLTNKPILFSGNYSDLSGKPTLFSGSYADLTNKPSIPAAQVNADWNATSGVSQILNKPSIPTITTGAFISNAPTNAPTDAATNAPTDSKTDYNVLTTVLGTLVDGLNTTNTKQNQISAIVNANAAKQNTMGGIVNTIASKLNLTFTSLKANAILANS